MAGQNSNLNSSGPSREDMKKADKKAPRSVRSGVQDLWFNGKKLPTKQHGKGSRWRAVYVDLTGQQHTKAFRIKADAEAWLNKQMASVESGIHIPPRDAARTVEQWCDEWKLSYSRHRDSTVDLAAAHIKHIVGEFGPLPLQAIRPTMVKSWLAKLKKNGLADSYVYTLHSRLSQILADAVHDGLLARNPCSRRTSPGQPKQKPYVATEEQVWAIHDAMPEHMRSAILLGAFSGLRTGEAVALRLSDVDFMRGVIHPKIQEQRSKKATGDRPVKTESSDAPIPVPTELTLMLSACVEKFRGETVVANILGEPVNRQQLEYHVRSVRKQVKGLPETFVFHDLRHFYASMLIEQGLDLKTVQERMRHGSLMTTTKYYTHLMPNADERTRRAVGKVLRKRLEPSAYDLHTATSETGSN
ncbi:MAG: site-specific integrase [Nocardiaceae bacterium]|nr:site-specific integrase [Nocardiaceae bacterium]